MGATRSTDWGFEPKVWSDHTSAYFDQKLVYGAFAVRNDSLKKGGTGLTVNFPFYNAISAAEDIEEDESLTVDNLTDDSFATSVFETGKAVGIKAKAFKATADDSDAKLITEAQTQMGRVMAEKVDMKLNNEITSYNGNGVFNGTGEIGLNEGDYDNLLIGFKSADDAATQRMNVRNLLSAKYRVFGDKQGEAAVCFMHPMQFLDFLTDPTSGFLKADANDPLSMINGYEGKIGNMAIITVESCKVAGQISGKNAYLAHFHKMNSFGIISKADIDFDNDKDILAREILISCTNWYGVKSFDRKVDNKDNKAGGLITITEFNLVR